MAQNESAWIIGLCALNVVIGATFSSKENLYLGIGCLPLVGLPWLNDYRYEEAYYLPIGTQ